MTFITGQNSGFTGNSKVWVLNADIDLAGNTIAEVGRHSTGFQGTLYGNKHSIKNGTIQYSQWINGTSHYNCGLFHYINGGSVYDLTIDSSIKLSMPTGINANVWVHMAGLAGVANNAKMIGISSKVSIDNRQTGSNAVYCKIGGLVGHSEDSTFIKCYYNGNLYFRGSATNAGANDVQCMGCIAGYVVDNITIDQCSIIGNVSEEFNGPNIGGILGRFINSSTAIIKITNVTLNANVSCIGACTSPDVGFIHGWSSSGNLNTDNGSLISNIYIVGGATYYSSSTPTYYLSTPSSPMTDPSKFSNIYLPIASGVVVYPSGFSSAACNKKMGSTSAVVTEANKNSAITSNFTVASSGAVTVKESFKVSFVKGAGATGGPADTTYSLSSSVQNKTGTASPSRTGYTFKGWSLLSPTGALSNSTPTTYSIPANSRGNINVYAVWELKDFTGTPSASTITYGANATFTAAAVSCPAGTTDPNLGVGVGYQTSLRSVWKAQLTALVGRAHTYPTGVSMYVEGTPHCIRCGAQPLCV